MDEMNNNHKRPVNSRRKPRSKMQIFKEAYLPVVIVGVALLLILTFIIGSIVRSVQRSNIEQQASIDASVAESIAQAKLDQEATKCAEEATTLARQYDYDSAIAILDSFSGDISRYAQLAQMRQEYTDAKDSMILWDDPSQVLNLSFQLLIADASRAFQDTTYGNSYNRNFVTTGEFSKILLQLYENGYILVRMSDVMTDTGIKELYLPNGKRPLIITQTNVNYNTYMVDGDGDKLPDKSGDGFASKLVLDENGNITCEMIDSFGQTVTGAYDLVPILDSFIATHPEFSYKGAKAVLAVTGYDGLFGYRTSEKAKEYFGVSYHTQQVEGATEIANALRESGYEFACYTYENTAYGSLTASQIQSELDKWNAEVTPILGEVNTLVFAKNSDIAANTAAYTGDKYSVLKDFGFTRYIGFCTDGSPWLSVGTEYIRQGRILVGGTNMKYHSEWFDGIFDSAYVLESTRGTIPS